VVSETKGPLAGRRVVRGCEPECERYYYAAVTAVDGHAYSWVHQQDSGRRIAR
jgi:hypothetical protein